MNSQKMPLFSRSLKHFASLGGARTFFFFVERNQELDVYLGSNTWVCLMPGVFFVSRQFFQAFLGDMEAFSPEIPMDFTPNR